MNNKHYISKIINFLLDIKIIKNQIKKKTNLKNKKQNKKKILLFQNFNN